MTHGLQFFNFVFVFYPYGGGGCMGTVAVWIKATTESDKVEFYPIQKVYYYSRLQMLSRYTGIQERGDEDRNKQGI